MTKDEFIKDQFANDQFTEEASASIGNRQSTIDNTTSTANNLQVLRRFVRFRSTPLERCDMCSIELGPDHAHLIEPATRRLICSCQACAILFSGAAETRYRRVPKDVRYLPDFQMTPAQWEGLMIPINMAFFFYSSATDKVIVLYPSPAGATESLLDLDSWQEIVECNPVLKLMKPDTEALLINRVRAASDYFIVPIDECYRLVGLIRTKWKGLGGGTDVWQAINGFFMELKKRSNHIGEVANA